MEGFYFPNPKYDKLKNQLFNFFLASNIFLTLKQIAKIISFKILKKKTPLTSKFFNISQLKIKSKK